MEIREVHIPEIKVPNISTPEIYEPIIHTPIEPKPDLSINISPPGCTYWHRDIENTGNTQLLLDDPNGVFTLCDSVFPFYNPMDYTPRNLVITEEAPPSGFEPDIPKPDTPVIPEQNTKEDVIIPPCPSNKDLRVGDFRNEKKIEIVVSHKLVDNECITVYEDVPFKDQYIPSTSQFVGVFSLALVGSSAPLILNAIKPIVKKVISALQKKEKK